MKKLILMLLLFEACAGKPKSGSYNFCAGNMTGVGITTQNYCIIITDKPNALDKIPPSDYYFHVDTDAIFFNRENGGIVKKMLIDYDKSGRNHNDLIRLEKDIRFVLDNYEMWWIDSMSINQTVIKYPTK